LTERRHQLAQQPLHFERLGEFGIETSRVVVEPIPPGEGSIF
jgi:hypothetical protein